jgi:hypothetical protein
LESEDPELPDEPESLADPESLAALDELPDSEPEPDEPFADVDADVADVEPLDRLSVR